jgi:hypothetical protein
MANTLKFGNGEWYGKKDTILAYNDLNSNYKPLPFNFSRDSKATVVNKDGLIEEVGSGQPRIDYKDDSKGALLLEPSRSNIVTDSATGRFKLPTPSLINTLAPDNSNLAVIPIVYSVANRYEYIISGGTYSTNAKLTYSWYRKRISTPMDDTYLGDLRPSGVNLSYVGDTKQIESNINGYDRFEAVLNITDGSATTTVRMYFGDVIGVGNSSIAYWGHQLEEGSYATSYIPTSGSAVTRLADTCNNGGNDQVINSTEGVFYFEGSALDDDGTDRKITLSDGSLNNAINFGFSRFSGNINAEVKSGGVLQTSGFGATGIAQDNNNKFALSWGGGVSKFYVNGTLASSYTSVTSPIGMNVLNFSLSSGFQKSYLNCKDIRVYNTALSDSELAALTQV